ncbi:AFG1-like ATPase [Nocardia amikacinitolerans]|uniref:cell division protein ZapE n=1 Tax=Nocardia amikacinitolerans TaxID=756689 RepID=UPI000834BF88|nr:cell division protein ZapE [Nocardia amikacinitolerans]MCP2320333.1 AFG1-like ATPase [Nocardia amikacinitolerans]
MTIELDPDQRAAADRLARLVDRRGRPIKGARGVYLHGRPGRGKTMLMDRFLATVDADRAKRYHFHWFFAELHSAAHETGSIDTAIERLLGTARLVCFDEFHVHDIGDAMLVARMLDALFARRIALVLTSNYPPTQLLPNPLFHDRFLPTIARIVEHLDVLSVDGPTDYRTLPNRDATRGFAAGRYLVCCVPTESKGTPPAPAASPARTVTAVGAAGPQIPAEDELPVPTGDRTLRAHTVDGDAITIPTHGRALQRGAADGDAVDVRIGDRALGACAVDGGVVGVPIGDRRLSAVVVDGNASLVRIGDRALRAHAVDGDATEVPILGARRCRAHTIDDDAVDLRIGDRALGTCAVDGGVVDVPIGDRRLSADAVDGNASPDPLGDRALRAHAVDGDATEVPILGARRCRAHTVDGDAVDVRIGDRALGTCAVDGAVVDVPIGDRRLSADTVDDDAVDVRIGDRALGVCAVDGGVVDVPTGDRNLLAHAVDDDAIPIPIGDRTLRARAVDGAAITFDFSALCGTPTSATDYVGLTRRFRRWTIRDVPRLREVPPDWAMRLVNLVDVLYDADLELTLCAAAPLPELVDGVVGVPDISRTESRLCEISQAVTAAAG